MLLTIGVVLMSVATTRPKAVYPATAEMRSWARSTFLGKAANATRAQGLVLHRQDYGRLTLRKSVMNTPLRLGDKTFARGLGTHSVSEIEVHVDKPGGRFEAEAGVDNNYDTGGIRGSVEFVVEVAGKEVFHSGIRRGSDPALPVRIDLGDAKDFTLKVLDGGDGPSYDQSDWADAKVVQPGGLLWLDDFPVSRPSVLRPEQPFSLLADGKPVTDWVREVGELRTEGDVERYEVVYRNAPLKLKATVELALYNGYPAADWTIHLENEGTDRSPMISDLRPLDLRLALPAGDATLHGMSGSTASPNDFVPFADTVSPPYKRSFAPEGGRSSDTTSPFFDLQWEDGGLIAAVGWTGQWSMDLTRDDAAARLQAGQQTTHFRLNPGEEVRTPRILLLRWNGGDPVKGQNAFRKLMLDHICAQVEGKAAVAPICQNTWFTNDSGNSATEANQLAAIAEMAKIGVEAYWLDAGWFIGGWPGGAGNWDPKPDAFPRGLKPLGDAAHKAGMKFVLWFEPERVTPTSPIYREHPEWVFKIGAGDGLFNLGDPAARKWLTNFLLERIKKWGVDVYRNDFNIAPLPFWTATDAPDRQGITEIRYVEGLYKMWDDLRAGRPGLTIDNCASGGRRIDIEMISRSYPLWQSDANSPSLPHAVPRPELGPEPLCPHSYGGRLGVRPLSLAQHRDGRHVHLSGPGRADGRPARLREIHRGDQALASALPRRLLPAADGSERPAPVVHLAIRSPRPWRRVLHGIPASGQPVFFGADGVAGHRPESDL